MFFPWKMPRNFQTQNLNKTCSDYRCDYRYADQSTRYELNKLHLTYSSISSFD